MSLIIILTINIITMQVLQASLPIYVVFNKVKKNSVVSE